MTTFEDLEESIKTLKKLNDEVTKKSIVIETNLKDKISHIFFDAKELVKDATNQATINDVFEDTNQCLAKLQDLLKTHEYSLLQESNQCKMNTADALAATEVLVPSSKLHLETSEPSFKQKEPHESRGMNLTYEEALNIIGLKQGASKEEIKKKYKQLVLKHHPDKKGDVDEFHKINEANSILMSAFEQKNSAELGDQGSDDTSPIVPLIKSIADFCNATQLALKYPDISKQDKEQLSLSLQLVQEVTNPLLTETTIPSLTEPQAQKMNEGLNRLEQIREGLTSSVLPKVKALGQLLGKVIFYTVVAITVLVAIVPLALYETVKSLRGKNQYQQVPSSENNEDNPATNNPSIFQRLKESFYGNKTSSIETSKTTQPFPKNKEDFESHFIRNPIDNWTFQVTPHGNDKDTYTIKSTGPAKDGSKPDSLPDVKVSPGKVAAVLTNDVDVQQLAKVMIHAAAAAGMELKGLEPQGGTPVMREAIIKARDAYLQEHKVEDIVSPIHLTK